MLNPQALTRYDPLQRIIVSKIMRNNRVQPLEVAMIADKTRGFTGVILSLNEIILKKTEFLTRTKFDLLTLFS